ncbi:MAG TPA: hypothetical protein VFB12_00440, partial [Ktedonobacteraceae bacterium]|nr:hypothetical protein [Ktedonobacteraceae bacterium]
QQHSQELQSLVHALDGHPLALTLIGRSLHRQSLNGSPRRLSCFLQRLVQDIQARFQLAEPLTSWKYTPGYPAGTALSLQTALDTSVHYLPLSAQTTLRALAVFAPKPHRFSEEAALAVCPTGAEDLDLLVDSGLIEACHGGQYQIHQTIIDYACLQGIDPEAEDRLISYSVLFVKSHEQDYTALEQNLHLIVMAFDLAFTRKQFDLLLQGIFALMPFVKHRHLYSLAEKLLSEAQQAALSLNDQDAQARSWLFCGMMAWERGDTLEAQQAYLRGFVLARQLSQLDLLAQFLIRIGRTLVDTEMGNQAQTFLCEGLDIMESLGDHTALCEIFLSLGELASSQGKSARASYFFQRGYAIALQTQNWEMAAALLQNLGVEADLRGEYEQAASYYQQALVYAQQRKDLPRLSALLMNQGILAWHQRQEKKAITLSLKCLKLARKIEHQMRISSVLQNLGMMMRVQGEYSQATEYLQESFARATQIGHRWLIYETKYELGMLALKQQQLAQAKQIFEEMKQQVQAMQAPFLVGLALFGLAQVAEQEGQHALALANAQESQAIFLALNNFVWSQTIDDWRATLQPLF